MQALFCRSGAKEDEDLKIRLGLRLPAHWISGRYSTQVLVPEMWI